jgi:hypothetical protein
VSWWRVDFSAHLEGEGPICRRLVCRFEGCKNIVKKGDCACVSSTGAQAEGSLGDVVVGDGDCEIVRANSSRVGDEVGLNLSTDVGTWA